MNNSVTPVDQLLDLRGKVAVVTGASGGIGSAIALRLAEAGASVAVHFHSQAALAKAVAEKIQQSDGSAFSVRFRTAKLACMRINLN